MKRYTLAVTLVLLFCASSAYADKSISSETESIRGVSVMYGGESPTCTVAISTGAAVGSYSVEIPQFRRFSPLPGEMIGFIDQDGTHYSMGTPVSPPYIEYPPKEFTSYSGRFLCSVLTHAVGNADVEWSGELDNHNRLKSIRISKKNFAAQTVFDPCGSDESCTVKGLVKEIGGAYGEIVFAAFQGGTPNDPFCHAALELAEGGKVGIVVSVHQLITDSPVMKLTSMFDACNLLSLAFEKDVPVSVTINNDGKVLDGHRVMLGTAPIELQRPSIFQRIQNLFH